MFINQGSYKVDGVELPLWDECHEAFIMMEKRIEDLEQRLIDVESVVDCE
tara:strand:- start:710 stop:859 length:150 start_codon:yes stop_codon:yes gene_type:complete